MKEPEFYIRTAHGETFYVDTLQQGIDAFLGDDGYRLTLQFEDHWIVLRRDLKVDEDIIALDNYMDTKTVEAAVTFHKIGVQKEKLSD